MSASDEALYEGFGLDGERSPGVPVGGLGTLRVPGQAPMGMGRPPGTAMRLGTAMRGGTSAGGGMRIGTAGGRSGTGSSSGGSSGAGGGGGGGGEARPMTSVAGAGFSSKAPGMARFMDASAKALGPAPPLLEKADNGPEDRAKDMERQVHALVEGSAEAGVRGDAVLALERAKEAGRKERALSKFKEANGMSGSINMDLTYSVCLNLANAYHINKMYQEALNTYTLIVKNRQYPGAGRLRVNMGNIHFEQKEFPQAIKMYRMALDLVPTTSKAIRIRIQRNIGAAHVRMGAYQDAITAYETIMDTAPEFKAGFNLVVCYYALGDVDYVKRAFERLLQIPLPMSEDEEDEVDENSSHNLRSGNDGDEDGKNGDGGGDADRSGAAERDMMSNLDISRDALREELTSRQKEALSYVTLAAKLIAPMLGTANNNNGDLSPALQASGKSMKGSSSKNASSNSNSTSAFRSSNANNASKSGGSAGNNNNTNNNNYNEWAIGYDWVIEQLKIDHASVSSELQISKALEYLHHKQFDRAIEELKSFEKKDMKLKARAATNLSFLYFLEGDASNSSKYADLAVRYDRYNAKALVNLGNSVLENKGELERAKELYLEAIGVEADCVEAIFNLGLVNRQLGSFAEALQAFEKLHTIVPSSPEVLHHIASLHEQLQNYDGAVKYFNYLIACVPSDATALAHLGQIFAKDDDEAQSYHYYAESYRFLPVNLYVISWLGVWYVKAELYEKAISFFERATEIQPGEVKWKLMVASCHRRMGNLQRALELYEDIHGAHPDNLECLRHLVNLCKQTHRRFDVYEAKMAKLERSVANNSNTQGGGGGGGGALTYAGNGGGGQQQQQQQLGGGGGGNGDYYNNGARGGGGGGGGNYNNANHQNDDNNDEGTYDGYGGGAGGINYNNTGGGGGYGGSNTNIDYTTGGAGGGGGNSSSGQNSENDTNDQQQQQGATSPGSRGFGNANDRFSAPSAAGVMGNGKTGQGGGGSNKASGTSAAADDFADADLSDLLTE